MSSGASRCSSSSHGDDAPPGMKKPRLLAVLDAAGEVVDELAERHAELDLVVAGPLDVARHREEARAGGAVHAHRRVPLAAAGCMMCGTVDMRLDVVDDRGRRVHALHRGERRLDARHRALAFEARQQARLVTGDVAAGAAVQDDLEVEAGAEDVLADEAPCRTRRRSPARAARAPSAELTAEVDERVVGTGSRTT